MKIKLPYELKLKFLAYEGLTILSNNRKIYYHEKFINIPFEPDYQVELVLDAKLLKFCYEWMEKIQLYFKTSYRSFKVDIGSYEGLWPVEIHDNTVIFRLDGINKGKQNWRDWFIKEDGECTLAVY
jgi:hypothetical protein